MTSPQPPNAPWARYAWGDALLTRLGAHIAAEPHPRDAAHDLSHILRVARLAATIAEEEGADVEACVAAALLHDLVYLPKNHPDSRLTAERAARMVPAWCEELGLAGRAHLIARAVETHSFSGGRRAGSLEAEVLQDADRLEGIGAIGVARAFATGQSFGAQLWHGEDPWAEARPLDDKAYSLDHFARKLLGLADAMNTAAGRRLASARHRAMVDYLEALRGELG